MIIWLASYPRSGNSLARNILQQCFRARNYLPQLVPILEARRSPETWFVKNHAPFLREEDKAICVIRDGRAALSSFRRFLRDFEDRDVSLESIVLGKRQSWAEHVMWVLERDPATTLILRYEEILSPSETLLASLSDFIGMPVVRPYQDMFATLTQRDSKMFGVGANGFGIEEVERECSEQFWRHNGAAMRAAGYSKSGVRDPVNA